MSEIISLDKWRKKVAKNILSKSQSKPTTASGQLGQTHTEEGYQLEHIVGFYVVLDKAWRSPFKLQSNFSRKSSLYVATCATLGFISNQFDEDVFIDKWAITPEGRDYKEILDEILDEITGGE